MRRGNNSCCDGTARGEQESGKSATTKLAEAIGSGQSGAACSWLRRTCGFGRPGCHRCRLIGGTQLNESALRSNDHVAAFHIDRKSTRLNSSHQIISYAVFCLKKKKHV